MAAPGTGSMARLVSSRRAGSLFMLAGVMLALLAALLVRNMSRQAQAEAAKSTQPVYLVMATQDIPEFSPIPAGAVAVKAFPSAFAPEGAALKVEDVVGKYSTTRITREQVVLTSQISPTRRTDNPSSAVPAGKVAVWMPVPDLLAQSGGLQPGDRVDLLLTINLTPAGATQARGMTTQSTVQNAEVFFVGPAAAPDQPQNNAASGQPANPNGVSKPGAKVMAVLVTPQDAVIVKFIKDSGGNVDLVLRSRDWQDVVPTESVNADALVDRFQFRVPDRWSAGK